MKIHNKIILSLAKIFPILPIIIISFLEIITGSTVLAGDFPINSLFNADSSDDTKAAIKEMNIGTSYMFETSGICSYYGSRFQNRKTSNGEHFDMNGFTAAHKELPFGMILKVTNKSNNESVIVRINDRGPFLKNRIIDLSRNAAMMIDMTGTDYVKLEGFIPGLAPIGNSQRETYYYGFSTSKPLVCLPYSVLEVLQKSSDFDEIMLAYIDYTDKHPDSFVYVFVPTDYLSVFDNYGSTLQYFLAKIDLNLKPFVDSDEVSEIK